MIASQAREGLVFLRPMKVSARARLLRFFSYLLFAAEAPGRLRPRLDVVRAPDSTTGGRLEAVSNDWLCFGWRGGPAVGGLMPQPSEGTVFTGPVAGGER